MAGAASAEPKDIAGVYDFASTARSADGKPVCTGRRASAPLKDDRRSFYFNVDGNLLMAPPTAHGPDGSVMYQQPYARLTEAADQP